MRWRKDFSNTAFRERFANGYAGYFDQLLRRQGEGEGVIPLELATDGAQPAS